MRARTWLACAGIGLAALSARSARADDSRDPASITARPSSCRALPWSRDAWIDLLRVELTADHVRIDPSHGGAEEAATPEVTLDPIRCEGAADSATLVFTRGEARLSRIVTLTDVPIDARPRVLAIAMAELVRQGLAPPKNAPPLPPPEAPLARLAIDVHVRADPAPPVASVTEPPAPALSIVAAGEARTFPSTRTGLFGGRVGVRFAPLRIVVVDLDAGALFGSTRDPLGDVDGALASLGVSVLAASNPTPAPGRVSFGVGPRVEAGLAVFRGRALASNAIESTARGPIVLVALTSCASFRLTPSLSAFTALDAGTTLLHYAARADDRVVTGALGAMLSLRIGFAFSP